MLISRKLHFLSYLEGFFYAIMVSSSESYALFFSVKKGLSSVQLALVSTVPLLLGAMAQWQIPRHIEGRDLGKSIVFFQGVQLSGLIGLIYCSLHAFPFTAFFCSLCLYWVGGLSCGPLWLDWISGLLPREEFRPFLARRNGFVIFITLTSYLLIASIYRDSENSSILAMSSIFILGAIGRLSSMITQTTLALACGRAKRLVMRPHLIRPVSSEREREKEKENDDGIKNWESTLWLAFVWTGIFKMAVTLSSPFFLPYMVKELKFTLWEYTVLTAMPLLGRTLSLSGWGRASGGDRPYLGLQICCLSISFIPFFWTISGHYPYLLGLELTSGMLWAGFELCSILIIQNFAFPGAAKIHGIHMAIMNASSVIGSCIGAYLLKQNLSYQMIFYLSSSMRLLVSVLFIFHITRRPWMRFTSQTYKSYLLTVFSLKPMVTSFGQVVRQRQEQMLKKRDEEIPNPLPNAMSEKEKERVNRVHHS